MSILINKVRKKGKWIKDPVHFQDIQNLFSELEVVDRRVGSKYWRRRLANMF